MSDKNARNAPTEQESRDVAEAARETEWTAPSFVRELFLGNFRLDLIHPYPQQTPEDKAKTDAYVEKLRAFMDTVDSDAIDRTGELPPEVVQGLKDMGAFGMKIPEEYGGIGLSQVGYGRAIQTVTSRDGSLTALLSAHQSIGVPQPIKMFGTPEQKKKYLPRLAKGAVSAFALTEPAVGSDPAAMTTTATLTEDGEAFILNGEKLWCTNGLIAELLVVMARTPSKMKNGKEIPQITAFVVEADTPGVEITARCRFMGLKAIQNAVIRFDNVRVPRENIILGEGKGLKLALMTLNTGRLTLPMSAAAGGKVAVEICRKWASERVQWGAPVGKHDAVAQMLGAMAANTFAMESMAELSSALADQARNDIRLEAAIAKLWTTEAGWKIMDDCLQIRGGRGYETADSLANRGEVPIPVERMMRDFRINLIFEGSSEIMKLFIAREAVDTHLQVAGDLIKPGISAGQKLAAMGKAGIHYAGWLPKRFVGWGHWPRYGEFGELATHLRFIDRTSRKLARTLFYAMGIYQAKLERKQKLLGRFVDIGGELYAMSAAVVRAQSLRGGPNGAEAVQMADVFCLRARKKIEAIFGELFNNEDDATYRLSQDVLKGKHAWLEQGAMQAVPDRPLAPAPGDGEAAVGRKVSGERVATQVGAGG
ncbi:MAG TPA: acyl-CoA dehydrogenase family protein [Longimicrobiaceae bacterium]|jgi:alkylation response protein AidB-like acyl-CoA dehydrogenase|nr:acyl-CoA dehydrogenase family protein [Longimicrobiaceae bacterium]